jgi:hypothetical protein
MQMDSRIPLAGVSPDIGRSMAQGLETGRLANMARRENALAQLYQEQGPGIMAGDPNALNALAGIDPMAGLGVQGARLGMDERRLGMDATRQNMRISEEKLRMAYAETEARAAQAAAQMSAEQRAAEAAKLERGLSALAGAQSPEQWDAFAAANQPELVGQFENREMLFAQALGLKAALERQQGPSNPTLGAQSILPDGTIIQSTSAGPRVFGPDGTLLQGQAAADAIKAANDYDLERQRDINNQRRTGALEADVSLGGAAAASKESGKIAQERGAEAFDAFGKAMTSISNLDEAITAIDNGAQAGAINKYLPNITLASASLDNALNRMGLDVIGATTFGALSEAEMRFALEVAAPRNLAGPELREWLLAKRNAQAKAAEAIYNAGRYLSQPGNSLAGWMQQRGANIPPAPTPPAAPAPASAGQGQQPPVQAPAAPQGPAGGVNWRIVE